MLLSPNHLAFPLPSTAIWLQSLYTFVTATPPTSYLIHLNSRLLPLCPTAPTICFAYLLYFQSDGGANKNSQRKTESETHNACRTRPKPSTESYTPARRMRSHPRATAQIPTYIFVAFLLFSHPRKSFGRWPHGAGSTMRLAVQLYRRLVG